ncbi:MAG: aquaporin [Actinobacteria bacterium]|nr:aquaporin [Actinomycetota bacterium]MBU1493032.1 aquaporin [Actinomycetota bacterium]
MKTWQKYAAEVFGTFMLVGIGTGAILGIKEAGEPVIMGVALAFGLALVTALYSLARVSGGHFNPAVTLAMFLDRRIGFTDTMGYMVAQALGAFLASGVFAIVLSRAAVSQTATQVSAVISEFEGLIAEAVFTLIFVFAILVLSKSAAHTKYLGMGAALAAVHMLGIPFTGTSVNPARSFAPALVGDTWAGFWVYMVGPMVGAVIAWVLYKLIVEGDTDFSDDLSDINYAATTT